MVGLADALAGGDALADIVTVQVVVQGVAIGNPAILADGPLTAHGGSRIIAALYVLFQGSTANCADNVVSAILIGNSLGSAGFRNAGSRAVQAVILMGLRVLDVSGRIGPIVLIVAELPFANLAHKSVGAVRLIPGGAVLREAVAADGVSTGVGAVTVGFVGNVSLVNRGDLADISAALGAFGRHFAGGGGALGAGGRGVSGAAALTYMAVGAIAVGLYAAAPDVRFRDGFGASVMGTGLGTGAVSVILPVAEGMLMAPFVLVGFFRQDRCILAVLFCKGPQGHEGQEHTDREKKR